jgi:hypothetical protein
MITITNLTEQQLRRRWSAIGGIADLVDGIEQGSALPPGEERERLMQIMQELSDLYGFGDMREWLAQFAPEKTV